MKIDKPEATNFILAQTHGTPEKITLGGIEVMHMIRKGQLQSERG